MLQIVKKMRQILIFALCIAMSLVAASSAMADTVTIANSLSGLTQYDTEWCGKIGATLGSTAVSGGIACVDISRTTYTGAQIDVNISRISRLTGDMANARFISQDNGFLKYEEAAWLLGQMYLPANSTQIGPIQFAMWQLFDPTYQFASDPGFDQSAVTDWLKAAAAIDPTKYNFSSVRIYTPTDITSSNARNQEFMSGGAIYQAPTGNTVPIPASFVLLGSGLLGLGLLSRRKKAALMRGDQK